MAFKITRYQYYPDRTKHFLIFPHWRSLVYPYQLFARFLPNFHSIVYHYPSSLLSANIEMTIKNFRIFEQTVLDDVIKLKLSGASSFFLYGVSLGTVAATRIANILAGEKINVSLILNLSSASFPFAVWNGRATQSIRKGLEKQGVDFETLKVAWNFLSPIENLNHLSRCKILAFLASHDEVMGPTNVARLAETLKIRPLTICHLNSWLGHHLGGIINLLRIRAVKKFLDS